MYSIHIRKELKSHTLELPELAPLVGRVVEIRVEVMTESAEEEQRSGVGFVLDDTFDLESLGEAVLQSGALSRLA